MEWREFIHHLLALNSLGTEATHLLALAIVQTQWAEHRVYIASITNTNDVKQNNISGIYSSTFKPRFLTGA